MNRGANRDLLVDFTEAVVEVVGPLQLDKSVLALFGGDLRFDAIPSVDADEMILVLSFARGGATTTAAATTTLVRIDAIDVGGRARVWRAEDGSTGRRYDGWFPLDSGVRVLVERGVSDSAATAVVRGELLIFLRTGACFRLRVRSSYARHRPNRFATEHVADDADERRFLDGHTHLVVPAPANGRQWWPGGVSLNVELDRRVTLAPMLEVVIGSACGVTIGFACMWFGLSAGRGWHGLERPRCAVKANRCPRAALSAALMFCRAVRFSGCCGIDRA